MRIFLAGATGAIGRALLPLLKQRGDQVWGMTRRPEKAGWLREAGATPVICDAFDSRALAEAVAAARPDAVVHQLTDIPAALDPRHYAEQMAGNDRLRIEGTRNLVAAARAAGAASLVAQSIAFAYAPQGKGLRREDMPLYHAAPEPLGRSVKALAVLETSVLEAPGLVGTVLRYGFLYGPGTAYAPDGHLIAEVRARRFPLIGEGQGESSFVHVEDAARAAVLALEKRLPGTYNIVDDDPAPASEWLPELARLLGARPPMHVPALVARLAVGKGLVALATEIRGASNEKARRELGFVPRFPSWREGFRATLAA